MPCRMCELAEWRGHVYACRCWELAWSLRARMRRGYRGGRAPEEGLTSGGGVKPRYRRCYRKYWELLSKKVGASPCVNAHGFYRPVPGSILCFRQERQGAPGKGGFGDDTVVMRRKDAQGTEGNRDK